MKAKILHPLFECQQRPVNSRNSDCTIMHDNSSSLWRYGRPLLRCPQVRSAAANATATVTVALYNLVMDAHWSSCPSQYDGVIFMLMIRLNFEQWVLLQQQWNQQKALENYKLSVERRWRLADDHGVVSDSADDSFSGSWFEELTGSRLEADLGPIGIFCQVCHSHHWTQYYLVHETKTTSSSMAP